MKVIQIIPTLAYGDAVGNDTLALKKVLVDMGYKTQIYAESIVPPLDNKAALDIKKLQGLNHEDIIIYHLSTGTQLNFDVAKYKGRKIIIYHNITPPEFFREYDDYLEQISRWALDGACFLADKADYCLADSYFNKCNLRDLGYKNAIDVLPIVVPFEDYRKEPSQDIIKKYKDGRRNIVFTGRVAPNKCHQDIIAAFACYKKYYNSEARLFLVGSYKESDTYYRKLKRYIELLEVEDVVFTGHIKFEEILAYYTIADIFLCMSEHEGFCVPLIEAMFFEVPIIAYNCTAVPMTLGDGGILIEKKDPVEIAALINKILSDNVLNKQIKENQKKRLEDFQYDKVTGMFKKYLEKFINIERF